MIYKYSSRNINKIDQIARIVATSLKQKKIVALSTDTIYGLVGIFEPSVIERIHRIKQRPQSKPFILAIAEDTSLSNYIRESEANSEERLKVKQSIQRAWPGKKTLVLPKNPGLTYPPGDTIALRMPAKEDNLLFYTVLQETGPLVVPSLNKTGTEPLIDLESIKNTFGSEIDDIFFDTDYIATKPSQIIDLTSGNILRE